MHPNQYQQQQQQQQPTSSLAAASSSKGSDLNNHNLPKVPSGFRRFVLEAEQELRIEVKSSGSGAAGGGTSGGGGGSGTRGGGGGAGSSTSDKICLLVQKGSCEIFGYELAVQRSYKFVTGGGGLNFPVYTFHGCVVDVGHGDNDNADADSGAAQDNDDEMSSDLLLSSRGINAYVAERDDTVQAIAYVNTHAQLEALRDEALAAAASSAAASSAATATNSAIAAATSSSPSPIMGPRVLVLGGSESGTSSLVKTLVSYAVKLGRTPLWVDLDPADSGIGLPGTLGVAIVTRDSLTLSTLLHGGGGMPIGTASPLSLWHGSTVPQPDLMRAQVSALAHKIRKRMEAPDNDWDRSSGMLVNAPSWLALDENWDVLRMALHELQISVVLLTGHDKLYSKLRGLQMQQHEDATDGEGGGFFLDKSVVIVKVPRSGGIVNRNAQQMRQIRSRSIRRYFYGEDLVETGGAALLPSANKGGEHAAATTSGPQPSLTPFLAQIKFDQLRLYRCTSMSLASSLLPLGATQTTEVVQLQPVPINEQITHHLLAVCHPHSVAQYDASGSAKDLYNAGVAGFVVVERVLMETEMLHLLAPCAGALPSHTLLIGDITWLD
jgi:polyribonucleotide 5'-hydroxyl-kinase